MGRSPSLLSLSSRSSSPTSEHRNPESLLPYLEKPPKNRAMSLRSVLGSGLYRRVFKWTVAISSLFVIFFMIGSDVSAPQVVQLGKARLSSHAKGTLLPLHKQGKAGDANGESADISVVLQDGSVRDDLGREFGDQENAPTDDDDPYVKRPWLRFNHLDGYFHGLKALVSKADLVPEYPNITQKAPLEAPPLNDMVPKPKVYDPYSRAGDVRTCYLDADNRVPAPAMYAYEGVPQHMPEPALGSYDIFGIRDDVCFDRFGRYGPYGLGYSKINGGAGVGADTEKSGANEIWSETGQINYNKVDWGQAQERCVAANSHRFLEPGNATQELPSGRDRPSDKIGRIAVVVRCYQGFKWTNLAILNFRAMVTELSLRSGGEYSVHLLLHVHDTDSPIWADDVTVQGLLDSHIPVEFHNLVTLWSEPQMRLFYPGNFGETLENESGADLHGVYRSAHMPLQVFAMQHPEYEHIWNWEMDMRCLGNYYELFDRLGRWAEKQPRPLLWERNARYYIPSYHGTWDNFTASVQSDVDKAGEQGILGPVDFPSRKPLRGEERGESVLPDNCAASQPPEKCGVGEAADIITLNPIFDTYESGWIFSNDVTGYEDPSEADPPRRCAIVTAARLSRRLLSAMHEETWRHHHSMFSEMFPPSIALHHGLKAVYAPHPTYFDRAWQPLGSSIDAAFNSGKDHSVSGRNSPYDLDNEHNQKGTTWYYHSEFAGLLWRRWLGYAQMDGRGEGGEGSGTERGGPSEERRAKSSGRMCLRSMLVHPIKHEQPEELE